MTKDRPCAYVYAVAGEGKHSRRVDQSVRFLQSVTTNEIFIVAGRNRHSLTSNVNILEVDLPTAYDDHQASMLLKSSLPTHLPTGKKYCYLDSDIIPLTAPDAVFDGFTPPVMLTQDHATIDQFSPYALNCGCLTDKVKQQQELQQMIDQYAYHSQSDLPKIQLEQKQERLRRLLSDDRLLRRWWRFLRFNLARKTYHLDDEFHFDKGAQTWFDHNGEVILYHEPNEHIQRHSPYTHDAATGRWTNADQEDIHDVQCGHLRELIHRKFGVASEAHKQLWNGGLFVFDDHSKDFMRMWHQLLLDMLADPGTWQTRDQAALYIAASLFNINPAKNMLGHEWNWLITEDNDLSQLLTENVVPHFIHLMIPMIDNPVAVDDLHRQLMRHE